MMDEAARIVEGLRKECEECICRRYPDLCNKYPCYNLSAADTIEKLAMRITSLEAGLAKEQGRTQGATEAAECLKGMYASGRGLEYRAGYVKAIIDIGDYIETHAVDLAHSRVISKRARPLILSALHAIVQNPDVFRRYGEQTVFVLDVGGVLMLPPEPEKKWRR